MTPRAAAFFDRDGVINVAPPAGEYVRRWSEFQLIPAAVDWIRLLNALDLLVVVVTNQRGVARGLMSAAALEEIHGNMRALLAEHGARVDDVLCCPHEENTCTCRKPRPGLVLDAARRWNIDLERSVMIGDTDVDRALAERCGMRFLRARRGRLEEARG